MSAEWLDRLEQEERQFLEALVAPVRITVGNAFASDDFSGLVEVVMRWGVMNLRPDRASTMPIERTCWLERASWRPALALMCHYGFVQIPDFPDHYYRRRGEAAAETLCGLWDIGLSSFYRLLSTARRRLAQLFLEQILDDRHHDSLQAFAQQEAYDRLGLEDTHARQAWHAQQAEFLTHAGQYLGALQHWRAAGNVDAALKLICLHLADMSSEPGLDAEMERLLALPGLSQHSQIDLQLVIAAVQRVHHQPEHELQAYERALRLAAELQDAASLGMVYSYLGKYYESRDADRAFACYQDSLDFLSRSQAVVDRPDAERAYAETLVKLAWLYILRNDPRARALLEKAQQLRATEKEDTAALLQQAWGEYWRRTGDLERALEHKHRALNIYERLGDRHGMLKTWINLGIIYDDMKQYHRAMNCYQRVLDMTQSMPLDPESLASTHLNLGACYYWLQDYDSAISEYFLALGIGEKASLRLQVGRAHYNLAEAHYARYLLAGNPDDERHGDHHITHAIAAWESETVSVYVESAHRLKTELFSRASVHAEHRILAQEKAAYYTEMSEIERYRQILQADAPPVERIQAHLAIARAYLSISRKEREEAWRLCEKHNLLDAFAGQFDALRQTFQQSETSEERLAQRWHETTHLSEAALRKAARRLLQQGRLTKSTYAAACGVGLATASKHLAQLAEAGLLRQIGKGASTHYVLNIQ
ncbi:MAG: tetratricopeptide repeat protein [Anaerolineae bacterium]|nr:tetratricopeptide repeat protein [Thermoflexales bacterium]MDW8408129.1 tetratricopeptide repeat protein [Anaerolineae bacterium]